MIRKNVLWRGILFSMGFCAGILGIAAHTNTPVKNLWEPPLSEKKDGTMLASNACVPDRPTENVYFISCGGIY